MSREELKREISHIITMSEHSNSGSHETSDEILNVIFDVLNKQTEEMTFAARHLMMWLTGDRPSEKNLKFWCERRGFPVPVGCENVDHVPPKAAMAAWVFEAMLNASPLAPSLKGQQHDK